MGVGMSNDRIATIIAMILTPILLIGLGVLGKWIFREHGFAWGAAYCITGMLTALVIAVRLDMSRERLPLSALLQEYRRDLRSMFQRDRRP